MKNKLNYIIYFLLYVLLFFVLSRASIYNEIYPFAFAMLFALAWANQKVWLIAPAYLAGYLINYHDFEAVLCAFCVVLLLIVPYYIHLLTKKPMAKWELFLYAFLSQISMVAFNITGGVNLAFVILEPVLGLLFLLCTISIFEPLIIRGFSSRLTVAELACGALTLMAIGDGLASLNISGFSFVKLFVSLSVLIIVYAGKGYLALYFASIMGIGTLLGNNNALFIAPFIIWALAATLFKFQNRIFPALALIASEALIGYYFQLYYSFGIIEFLPCILSTLIFLALPKKFYKKLAILFSSSNERMAIKSVINRNRDLIHRRLNNLSEVFFDMNNVFKKMIKSQMSEEEVTEMLYEEIKNTICKGCSEQKHCHRTFSEDTKLVFKQLIKVAMERGKVTLLDLPSYLASRCGKSNVLISEINTLTSQYKSYSKLVGNVDTSKLLISDQLSGISGLMKDLSTEVDSLISFDSAREEALISELISSNIVCSDAVVYEKDAKTSMASVVVREEDANKLKLPSIVSKICNQKMTIYDIVPTEKAGLVNVNLKTAPSYDCIFGLASQPRSGSNISGDCHSIERLDGDKFMFAICDGMGSGEKASEKSETTIDLIENFYKAGFDNEIILSSVNKLLNLEKDDIFSTIDLCTIDLKSGIADFVKMGASSSYIRGEEGCKIIESGSLPIGVLQEAKAITKKVVLKEKDFIIICSDGINDSFGSDSEFKDFLLTIKSANPQEQADLILQRAKANNNGYAVDDMTCIVVKII